MKYLNIKLYRDILRHWTQFFSVFLMALLSVLIFVGLQGAWKGLEVSLNNFIENSNLPNIWVYSTNFSKEDISQIRNINEISDVREKIRVTVTTEDNNPHYISLDSFDTSKLNYYLVDGEKINNDLENAVWLNKEYAEVNNIKIGDIFSVKYNEKQISLKVYGLIQSADKIYFTGSLEFLAPNYENYGYGVVSEKTISTEIDYKGTYNLVEIYSENNDYREQLEEILGNRYIAYYDRNTLVEVSDALDRVHQIRNLSFLFSFVFILLAILAMYTTIRRLIEKQTNEIALLKALGFSNKVIGYHYVSFGLVIGGIGALLGALISPFMSWFVLGTQKSMFSIPEWKISYSFSSFLVITIVILICMISAFFASREAIMGLPALFLRGGVKKKGRKIVLEKYKSIWEHLNIQNRWAIRDASFNKIRLLMGIIGVAGGMMLLIAGLGMPQSIYYLVDKAYNKDFTYKYRIETTNYDKIKSMYEGQWIQISQARFSPDDGFNRLLIILGDGNFVNLRTENDEVINNDGIYITKAFAERANIKAGQSIKVILNGNNYNLRVAGIIKSETNQGAYITQELWEKLGGEFYPSTMLLGEDVSLSEMEQNVYINSIIPIDSQKENAYNFVNNLMSVFLMIIGFAIMLVVVVLYNLGSLNFVEHTRDYATLRVLGFYKKELRNITMIENIVTTFIGWVLGIPLGGWFLANYVRTFSTIRLEYISYLSIANLLISSVIVWIFSLTTTFLISRRIKKINMVEVLKSIE